MAEAEAGMLSEKQKMKSRAVDRIINRSSVSESKSPRSCRSRYRDHATRLHFSGARRRHRPILLVWWRQSVCPVENTLLNEDAGRNDVCNTTVDDEAWKDCETSQPEGVAEKYYVSCLASNGRLQVSTKARDDVNHLQLRSPCEHLLEHINWGADQHADVGNVQTVWAEIGVVEESRGYLCWSKRWTTEALTVQLPTGTGMINVDFRPAAGSHGFPLVAADHDGQSELALPKGEAGSMCISLRLESRFVLNSVWVCQVGILGDVKELRVAEIPCKCPGLAGPDDTTAW